MNEKNGEIMSVRTVQDARLQIGVIANALRVLRHQIGGHRLNEAETVAKLADIEKRVEPLEGALWRADVVGAPTISDRPRQGARQSARKKSSGSLIYLASPYSDPDPAVRQARFEGACKAAAALIRSGDPVFSPVAHSHGMTAHGLPACDWEFWERLDRTILNACTSLVVLMLPGWRNSFGVYAELVGAYKRGLPVRFVYPEELQDKGARTKHTSVAVFN